MAQQFYKGAKREQVATQTQALQGPDISQVTQANSRRTDALMSSINALNALGSGVIQAADKTIKYEAQRKGVIEAGKGEESSASQYAWGGPEQQLAYNTVRGELQVRDMPGRIEELIKNDPDIKKPLDEMMPEERTAAYAKARQAFFKEKGIDGATYQAEAEIAANEIQAKQLTLMDKQARDLGQAKATANVEATISSDARVYGGDPAGLEAHLEANFNKYSIALGGSKQAQEAIAKGLLGSVTNENPSLEALTYLKSPEAKKRFSSFEGFDQVVKQADIFATQAKAAFVDKQKKTEESGFYINLSSGGFTSREDVEEYLGNTRQITAEEKFNLTNKAVNYLETKNTATNLQAAVDNRQYNIVNSQKPEVLGELFGVNVGRPDALNLRSMTQVQENALVEWVKKGNNVPSWVSKFGDSPLNNGDQVALDSQLKLYSNLKTRLGESGTGTIFSSNTQAKLEEWARLRADTTLSPADRKKTLDNFDSASQKDAAGMSLNDSIQTELTNKDNPLSEQILNFAKEGGSNIFGGADDLQPAFTFSNMTQVEAEPSLSYATKSVTGNYATYRRAGIPQEQALSRAQADFQKKNQWVEWNEGSSKNSYIPREYGESFAEKSMAYLDSTEVLKAIAVDENLTVEEVRKRITIQPARNYNSTRKVAVYFDGIEKNIGFTADQFHREESLMQTAQKDKIGLEYQRRINSPEFKAQQQQISTIQKRMEALEFFN